MAIVDTKDKFIGACSQLIEEGLLTTIGARYINGNDRIVIDEDKTSGGDITPDTATLEAALDRWLSSQSTKQQQETDDDTAFTDLLSVVQAGITQISNDKIAVNDSTIPPEIKVVLDNILNRQERLIKAIAGAIRKIT